MMSDAAAPNVRFRKPEGGKKQGNFTFRTSAALRADLVAAAEESGRSVSEEITARLENEMRTREIGTGVLKYAIEQAGDEIAALVGGRQNLAYFIQLSHHMVLAQMSRGTRERVSWTDDAAIRNKVRDELLKAVPYYLENPPQPFGSVADEIGERVFSREWNRVQLEAEERGEPLDGPPNVVRRAWVPPMPPEQDGTKDEKPVRKPKTK